MVKLTFLLTATPSSQSRQMQSAPRAGILLNYQKPANLIIQVLITYAKLSSIGQKRYYHTNEY